MTASSTYITKRGQLETYFDRTAVEAWAKLTSDAPVSGIRATVRAGRDQIRQTLLDWLPEDLTGRRILDAGCGAGQLSIAAARRGADVIGVDLSPTLLDLATERYAGENIAGSVKFIAGDMFDPALGTFDHVVAMDSLIHYDMRDVTRVVDAFAARTSTSMVFTIAPRTPMLSIMHAAGQFFPKSDRSPAINPINTAKLGRTLTDPARARQTPVAPALAMGRCLRVSTGFYISEAMELHVGASHAQEGLAS